MQDAHDIMAYNNAQSALLGGDNPELAIRKNDATESVRSSIRELRDPMNINREKGSFLDG